MASRRIYAIPVVERLHPQRGRLKDSLGCGYFGMLRDIKGERSLISVPQCFSMAQRFGWREAPSQTTVLVDGYRGVGCLLTGSWLGRSMADFDRRLMSWRPHQITQFSQTGLE